MKIAIVAITEKGLQNALKLKASMEDAHVYASAKIGSGNDAIIFDCGVSELIDDIFGEYDGLILCMALGIVVRVIAPHIRSKHTDPAVVSVDEGGRFAISALSGHEGRANELAIIVANILGAEPVITTASESVRDIVIGIGCRKGAKAEDIITAIETALKEEGREIRDVRCISTIDLKRGEPGLIEACAKLGTPLRIISSDLVKYFNGEYRRSSFVNEKIGIEGVCEPCALLTAKNPKLIMPKRILSGVTVAMAKEN